MSETFFPRFRRIRLTPMRDALRGRFTGRLDWRPVVTEAGLPLEISRLILQVVKRTRLWRIEKSDVAHELISHFQDGLSADKTAAELIGCFGDPAQAAKLIRRAKRRGRPTLWHIWNFVVRFSALVLGIYFLLMIRFFMGRPSPTVNYIETLNEPILQIPNVDRAWPIWQKAILLASDGFKDGVPLFTDAIGWSTPAPPWSQTAAWLDQHSHALDLAREAGQIPALGYVYGPGGSQDDPTLFPNRFHQDKDQPLVSLLLPHLNLLRPMAMILSLDARRAAELNDGSRAAADLISMYGLARQLRESDHFAITDLVANAIADTALSRMQSILAAQPNVWNDAQLIRFAHLIAGPEVAADLFTFNGERDFFYDALQRIYTDDGHGSGRITPKGLQLLLSSLANPNQGEPDNTTRVAGAAAALPTVIASRAEMLAKFNQLMDESEANFHKPIRDADWKTVESEVLAIEDSPVWKVHYLLVAELTPALQHFQAKCERVLGRRDGTLVGIALELFHRRYGNYPATLNELTPQFLPQVPTDRITGDPIKYRLIAGKPVIYSVGADRADDGGKRPENKMPYTRTTPALWPPLPTNVPHGDWVLYPPEAEDSSQ